MPSRGTTEMGKAVFYIGKILSFRDVGLFSAVQQVR